METLLTLVLQVVLAVVVAKLTLAGSRSQKWWERKTELYASLIEKLYDIQKGHSHWLNSREKYSPEPTADLEKELKARAQEAVLEVQKLVCVGTFLLSNAVHQDLCRLQKAEAVAVEDFAEHRHLNRFVGALCAATTDCIDRVREHSKDDLGLNSRFGRFIQKVRSFSFE